MTDQDTIGEWIAEVVSTHPDLFNQDTIESLNYLRVTGDMEDAERAVEDILIENDGCTLCLSVPMTTNCNNARCQDL